MDKHDEMKKYQTVIPMFKAERDIIDKKAQEMGLTRAAYCRYKLLGWGRHRYPVNETTEVQNND